MATAKQIEQAEAMERLHGLIKPGQTIYAVLRHVSQSGMMRHIDFYTFDKKGNKFYLSYLIATVLDYRTTDSGALKVGGCGMDMGFHVTYSLSRTMYRDGYRCTGKGCGANSHFNDGTPRDGRRKHKGDGGYALHAEWI